MKRVPTVLLLIHVCGLLSAQTSGQEDGTVQLNTITTAVPFLMISGDPQQMGSGDVGVVSSDMYHSTAFTSNAALLANGHRYVAANTNYTPWLRALVPDINLVTHTISSAFHRRHAVGFQTRYLDLGNITFTDNTGQTIGNFNANELALQANYATWFPIGISVGVAAKYVYSNLTGGLNVGGADTRPGQAFAADLGFNYRKHY